MSPNSEPTQAQRESRLRLDQQVAELKKRKEAIENVQLDATHGMRGVVEVGECLREVLPELEAMTKRWNEFIDGVKTKLKTVRQYCDKHPETELAINYERTYYQTKMNEGQLATVFHECEACREDRRQAVVNEKWKAMGIPQKTVHATFSNFKTDDPSLEATKKKQIALTKVVNFVNNRAGFIVMLGTFGTGKTHLASAAIKSIGSGLMVTEYDLIGELRQSYVENSGQNDLVEKYRRAPVFVLDELSLDVVGKDIPALLYRILGYRHDKGLLTIITSNEDADTVKEIVGGRLVDRMKESFLIVNFDWKSSRW